MNKRITMIITSIILSASVVTPIVKSANPFSSTMSISDSIHKHIKVISYDPTIDYRKAMYDCAVLGDERSLALGHIYEIQRNMKLTDMEKENEQTSYFSPGKTGNEIRIEMLSDSMKNEYSVAGMVYEHLAKEGYSDVFIAGILGNMMNETGGNTLNLNPYIYDPGEVSYGLCQWSVRYCQEVINTDISTQLDYLSRTMPKNIEQFGGSFDKFKNMDNPESVAIYFNKYYERGIGSEKRVKNAIAAYEWIRSFD